MTDPKWITWALDQARRDLIDLTRRNRLLHAPLGGKRPWCTAITGHTPDQLFEKLHRQEHFRGYAFDAYEEESSEQQPPDIVTPDQIIHSQEAASTRRPRLQTRLEPDKLQKRLTKIFREERTLEEEQGLSTLYLAMGFLKWFDNDQAEESFAPLLLLPVTMIRIAGADGYLLRGRDDEIVSNVSLREKLKSNFDINLPDIPDNEQWKPSSYYDSVAQEIRRQPRWHVENEAVGLGFFTFSKFLMWRDLHPASWLNNALLDHPLVNILLGQSSEFEALQPLVPDDEPIDHRIDLSKCTHVVDADSSQAIVIEEARIGRNLVVQGPPGTGKSQTITNAIASAIHNGKTVLFVAEKTAALEVVHDRLRKAGLGALCLELHSRKANKREVLKSLEHALKFSAVSEIDHDLPSKLAGRRDKLNQWSSAIHKPIAQTGRSAFDVIGLQVKLRSDGVRLLDNRLDDAANWTASKLASAEVALDRAAEGVSQLPAVPKDHPWFGTEIEAQSPFDLDRLNATLNTTLATVKSLASELKQVFELIGDNRAPSISDAFATIKALRHVAAVSEDIRDTLANPAWERDLASLEIAIDEGQRLAASVSVAEGHFRNEAWTYDTTKMLLALRADGASFFRRFSRRYRRANADLSAICRDKVPKNLEDRVALAEMLAKAQEDRREFTKKMPLLSSALGAKWAGYKTPWIEARALAAWTRYALSEIGGARLLKFAARTKDLRVFSAFADKLAATTKAAQQALEDLQTLVRPSFSELFGSQNCERIPLSQLFTRMTIWQGNLREINDWAVARNAMTHLRSEGLGIIADGLINGLIQPKEARPITDLLIAESLWRRAAVESPELSSLEGATRTGCVLEFRDFDQQRIRAARHEVLARYLEKRPNGQVGEMGIIRAETNKKRGHRPIRKLISDAGSAVQQLKPIFLMSPLSVAQFLPPGRISFDLLVIDEASQVSPEDALGVVARANQIVVVGDDKQLPPTNFFKMVNAGNDYEEEDTEEALRPDRPSDFESILTLARTRGMSERMLAWHYRSKHPSLIALSNEECYAGRLLLPPSPFVQTSEFGLSLVRTSRGHYDRGGTRCDLIQAEEVAKAVAQHLRQYPNKSLGVACLSVQQRDAVDDMIDKAGIRAEVEEFMPKEERLFVKNLEAVQGDERDVIFISVGYGVAPNQSKPFLNFGPVSQDGGERRLNVLASRAREKCVVFSSITSADIPADSEARGTRMLRALLDFSETGKLGAGTLRGDGFESPFEEAVARIVREAGFHVHPQVGVKGFRIDLGVIDPSRPGEYILGVECDGAAYHSARSARDRDRLRQEVLEGLGWRLHRIWSTDWFRNPHRETDRLIASIKDAKNKTPKHEVEVAPNDDLPEMEEQDSEPQGALQNENDEPDMPSNTVRYKECALTAPFRRELLELSAIETARLALAVIEFEGPIHTEEIARRIREAFGLQKTGKRILAHVRSSLNHLSLSKSVEKELEFWSIRGQSLTAIRNRRNAPLSLRRATMIAPEEYRLALTTIIAEAAAISRDDLVVETARLFGFDRTGPDLKEAIDCQAEKLVNEGRLYLDENGLRLPDNSAALLQERR